MSNRSNPRPIAPKGVSAAVSPGMRSPEPYSATGESAGYSWVANSPEAAKSSAPGGNAGKTKRNCVSNACVPCRKKRSKCDGAAPCAKCASSGKPQDCRYDVENDHRRKGALRKRAEDLQKALEQKEHQMDRLLRALRGSDDDSIRRIVKRIKRETDLDTIVASLDDPDPLTEDEADFAEDASEADLSRRRIAIPRSQSIVRELGVPEAIISPANRSGVSSSVSESLSNEERVRPSSWTKVTDDDDFVTHLIDLYFTWDHHIFRPLSEARFRSDFEAGRRTYCSSLLVNAICSVGCRFSTRPEAWSSPDRKVESRGLHFHKESVEQLTEENSSPQSSNNGRRKRMSRLTTMQAVILISIEEAANNNDAVGEFHFTTFTRLLEDESFISLFQLDPEHEEYNGDMEDYWTIFWSYYITEASWAMGVNRAANLPHHIAGALELPNVKRDSQRCPWFPYKGPESVDLEAARHGSQAYQPAPAEVSLYINELFQYTGSIMYWLHSNDNPQLAPDELLDFYTKLMNWRRNLPEVMRDGLTTNNPWVMIMHMIHRTVKLVLFRPFCSLRINYMSTVNTTPLSLATTAAKECISLMLAFDAKFGVEYAPSMFAQYVANVCIIRHLSFPDPEAIADYKICIGFLEKSTTVFPCFQAVATALAGALPAEAPEYDTNVLQQMLENLALKDEAQEELVNEGRFYKAIAEKAKGIMAPGFEEKWEPMSQELLEKTRGVLGVKKQSLNYLLN